MGKGGAGKVYDFLMSIHYGLCHGPVDHLNKVWIKDKSVLCGVYGQRVDIETEQPDLFGGDEGEGGPVGTIEFYPGSNAQVSSEALAARVGRTAATMPGYRGLASLFFRGGGVGAGYRWTSNNPYLPGLKASVSRFPTTLSTTHAKINPVAGTAQEPIAPGDPSLGTVSAPVESEGAVRVPKDEEPKVVDAGSIAQFSLGTPDWNTLPEGNFIDLIAEGAKPEDIAEGVVSVSAYASGQVLKNGQPSAEPGGMNVAFFDADGDLIAEYRSGVDAGITGENGSEENNFYFEWQVTRLVAPPGAVRVGFGAWAQPFLLLFAGLQNYASGKSAEIGSTRWVFCDPDNSGLRLLPNANPAHIIHETMVNGEWGKGESPARIDTASFEAAAETFFNENFGLAFIWVRQGSVEDFIQQVLDHVQATLFIHPRTGLWTLKPLRGDYDAATLPALDPSNCVASKRKRRAWGETVNEVTVKYTDPQTEEEASVTAHNLANIAIQGGVISETRPYPGIRDEWLARQVADRDVIEAGQPLYAAEIEADRSFWRTVPGDVLRFTWPEDGIEEMVVRVVKINYGSPLDRKIKMHVVEDVFSLEKTAYGDVQSSEWVSDRTEPVPLAAEMAMTAPLPLLTRAGFTQVEIDDNYPAVGAMLIGTDEQSQAIDISVHSQVVRNDGTTTVGPIATVGPARSVVLETGLAAAAQSSLPAEVVSSLTLASAQSGDLLLLGESEALHEIVMLGTYDPDAETWPLYRGLYDTVPVEWPAETRLWVLPEADGQLDPTERAPGEAVTYRLLPRTSEGTLPYGDAADVDYTATERPHQPFRPANCQIDGNGFALADYTGEVVTFPLPVTWATRNRGVEDQIAARWTQASIAPETGQTTVIRVFDAADTLAGEIADLVGSSYDMASGDFFGLDYGYLEFVSERDGIRSRPGARRWFDLRSEGYGAEYGESYG